MLVVLACLYSLRSCILCVLVFLYPFVLVSFCSCILVSFCSCILFHIRSCILLLMYPFSYCVLVSTFVSRSVHSSICLLCRCSACILGSICTYSLKKLLSHFQFQHFFRLLRRPQILLYGTFQRKFVPTRYGQTNGGIKIIKTIPLISHAIPHQTVPFFHQMFSFIFDCMPFVAGLE